MKNSNTKKQYVQPALKKYGEVSKLTMKGSLSDLGSPGVN